MTPLLIDDCRFDNRPHSTFVPMLERDARGRVQTETPKECAMQIRPQPRKDESTDSTKTPPAGPHAEETLTDREKTPGTGSLPEKNQPDVDVGPD